LSRLIANELVCDENPAGVPYRGVIGSEPCRNREVKLLRPAMLFRPTEIEVVEFRPEANVLALESSSRRLPMEVDVPDRSRSLRPTPGAIAAGEVGAEDVES